jgi:hypothetical protein
MARGGFAARIGAAVGSVALSSDTSSPTGEEFTSWEMREGRGDLTGVEGPGGRTGSASAVVFFGPFPLA